ncbi:sulfite exporter TauE/SafE family protein [bacterium]|nr:sulfite exporter TauE/SafE family protein [bacterium]
MLTLILTCVPLSLFIGIAASAIGYTAWSLIMPILFVFFGFDIYLALFISLLIDSANAILVTFLAARKKEVDFRLGTKLVIFACFIVLIGIYLGTTFIPDHTEFFKDSVAYGNLIFVFFFFHRGRKIAKINSQPTQTLSSENNEAIQEKEKSQLHTVFLYLGISFIAIQTGLIGVGGGMMYAVFMMFLLKFSTVKATGTAMFITSITALVAATGIFLQIPDRVLENNNQLVIIPIIVVFSLVGTLVGKKISNRLSEENVNYLVSAVVAIACLVAILQKNAISQ